MAAPLLTVPTGGPVYKPLQECKEACNFEPVCGGERHSIVYLPKSKMLILEDHSEAQDPYAAKAFMELGDATPPCFNFLKAFRSRSLCWSGWTMAIFQEEKNNYNRQRVTATVGIKSFWDMDNLVDKLANSISKEMKVEVTDGAVINTVKSILDALHSYDPDDLKRELRRI